MASSPRRPTIRDVAQIAGVSRGTVSRVLNDERWVSAASRAAVERAITETGYRVNRNARNLAKGPSTTIAFLLTTAQPELGDPVTSAVVRGCARALAADGSTLILLLAGTEEERQNVRAFLSAGQVDGALLVAAAENAPLRADVTAAGVPLVVFSSTPMPADGAGSVTVDEAAGAREVVAHILQRGRRRIGFVAGPEHSPAAAARLAGFRAAFADLGRGAPEPVVEVGDWGRKSGVRAMRRLLERDGDLDAVIAANDRMAGGALDALRDAGLFVPDDVAVGALEDSPLAELLDLTAASWPLERVGAEMVAMLGAMLAGGEPVTHTIPSQFTRRGSA